MKHMNDTRSKYLSIIIPVYNEEDSIPHLHERIQNMLAQQHFSYEVLYIDDGSNDTTFQQLSRLIEHDEHVQIVRFRRNFGQTAAMAAGIEQSHGEILIFLDGDLQNDPIDIPRLLAKIEEGYDVVSGWRKDRQDAQWSRKFPSMIANKLISRVTGVYLHDYGCTLKAYRAEVFHNIHLYGEMHRFIPAYAALSGATIAELAVTHHARQFGKSKYGISRIVRVLLDLTTLKFLGSFATKPLYAFGIPGLASLGLGIGTGCYALGRTLGRTLLPSSIRRRRTPLLPTSLILSGFGLLSIVNGLIAELLMRTYYEVQEKPIYTIKQIQPNRNDTIQLVEYQTPEALLPEAQRNGQIESVSNH
jgi:glycosyltransferase involved in cell wall biosynthesis